jgi:hypothetical protein
LEPGLIIEQIINVANYNTWAVFVWDKYGYYGLVGFMMVARTQIPRLVHLVFSCRVMHMGIEQITLSTALNMFPNIDISALVLPMPNMRVDWVQQLEFQETAVRQYIQSKEKQTAKPTVAVRIMMNCQSGGLAHFSKYRDIIAADNVPNIFSLPQILSGAHEEQQYPPTLIYGAAIDYSDALWPLDTRTNLQHYYRDCVTKFCHFIQSRKCKMLVILPPENLSDNQYIKNYDVDYSRLRTIFFNTVWREVSRSFAMIDLLELSDFAIPQEAHDVGHYYAGLLKKISHYVDAWLDNLLVNEDRFKTS